MTVFIARTRPWTHKQSQSHFRLTRIASDVLLEQAAAAYDKAALYRELEGGPAAKMNFPSDGYIEDMDELAGVTFAI